MVTDIGQFLKTQALPSALGNNGIPANYTTMTPPVSDGIFTAIISALPGKTLPEDTIEKIFHSMSVHAQRANIPVEGNKIGGVTVNLQLKETQTPQAEPMDRRAAIKQLKKLAQAQHQILEALAQDNTELNVGDAPAPTSSGQPLPTSIPAPSSPHVREADEILKALPPGLKSAVALLEVRNGTVMVRFKPGKQTQQTYDGVLATVKSLQEKNVLQGQSYAVKLV